MGLTWTQHQAGVKAGEWSAHAGGKRAWDAENKQRYKISEEPGLVFLKGSLSLKKEKHRVGQSQLSKPLKKIVLRKIKEGQKIIQEKEGIRKLQKQIHERAIRGQLKKIQLKERISKKIIQKKESIKKLQKQIHERAIRSQLKKIQLKKRIRRQRKERIYKKLVAVGKQKVVSKRVLRKSPRATLDLRSRPEREVPVKQHGFNEGEISSKFILSQ